MLPSGKHWADALVDLYSEGASDVEVCKELKLPWKEFDRRCKNEPLFAELVDYGRLASKAWWVSLGRKSAKAGAPSQAYQFWRANMANQFGWADKTEVQDGRNPSAMSTDELKAQLSIMRDKIAKKPKNVEMQSLMEAIN